MHAMNISITQIYSAMARRKGKRRQLDLIEKDAHNYTCQKHQSQLKEGDA